MFHYKTQSQNIEPTENDPSKVWKKIHIYKGDWDNSMEHVFVSGSSDGGNKCFYKWKSQVLQLNGASHSIGGGYCATEDVVMCAWFVDM